MRYNNVIRKNTESDFEAAMDARYVGKTWQYILEENEWFDGEKEIEAAAKERWRKANQRAIRVPLPEVTRALRKARLAR